VPAALPFLADALRARLLQPLPGPTAQRTMAGVPPHPGWSPDDRPDTARQAAALVLLYEDEGEATIALTLRRDDLPHHPGQLSLPGGALDPGESPLDAALREVDEEIGVPPSSVDLVGSLSTLWIPVSNFVLTPFVGICHTPPAFAPHTGEVAALVPLPLPLLTDPLRIKRATRNRDGIPVDFPYIDIGRHRLWGATAMVLAEFAEVVRTAELDATS
jgi:8-oxo-dGTP pyrophosphatase MutT (NUDIX family)